MKILLTGSNGFLGSRIHSLLKNDYNIITLNRTNSDFNFDISKPFFINEFDIETVIHCAGLAHIKKKLNIFHH